MPVVSLDQFRQLTGYHPLHFWELHDPERAPVESACNQLVRQYEWQNAQREGRRNIETALVSAETTLAQYLGYRVGTQAVTFDHVSVRSNGTLVLPEGHIQTLGREVLTLLGAYPCSYSDADGDGLTDTATVTIFGLDQAYDYRVQFTKSAQIAGQRDDWTLPATFHWTDPTTATITLPSRLLVKPVRYEAIPPSKVTGFLVNDLSIYVPEVAVYHRVVLPSAAVVIDGVPSFATVCDAEHGVLRLDRGCSPYPQCRPRACNQSAATVSAVVGRPLTHDWMMTIAKLAAAYLSKQLCECKEAGSFLHLWQQDISRMNATEEFAFKEQAINNPIGTRRGHIAAWNAILQHQQSRGFRF